MEFRMNELSLFFFICAQLFSLVNKASCLRAEQILNGEEAEAGQIKYQISIQMNGTHRCGGGIIGDKFGITAAHCFIDEISGLLIHTNYTILISNNVIFPEESAIRIAIKKLYIPKDFVPVTVNPIGIFYSKGDIAVIELEHKLGLRNNSSLFQLKLPNIYSTYIRKTATVTGHGFHKVNYTVDPQTNQELRIKYTNGQVRFAEADILSNYECSKIFNDRIFHGITFCGQMKQLDTEVPKGICGGDSGSPLVYNKEVCIGISIAGPYDCDESEEPAIYTRVSHYSKLINNILEGKITKDVLVFKLKQTFSREFEFELDS